MGKNHGPFETGWPGGGYGTGWYWLGRRRSICRGGVRQGSDDAELRTAAQVVGPLHEFLFAHQLLRSHLEIQDSFIAKIPQDEVLTDEVERGNLIPRWPKTLVNI